MFHYIAVMTPGYGVVQRHTPPGGACSLARHRCGGHVDIAYVGPGEAGHRTARE